MSSSRAREPRKVLRRGAGRARRRLLQGLQVIDPIRLTLPAVAPDARIALACVYRARNADVVRALLATLPPTATVRLWSLDGEVPADLAHVTKGQGPGLRFTLLNRLVADVPARARRDGLILSDDDLRFLVGDVGGLVAAAQRASLDLYQPAHSALSYANWAFVRRRALTYARQTDFVEQGPIIGLSAQAQAALLPLPEDLGMAWGVEVRWWAAALRHGLRQGIVDAVAIQHLAPTAQGYDRAAQERTLDNELRNMGLTDLGVLQQTVARTRLGTGRSAPAASITETRPTPAARVAAAAQPCVSVVVPTHRRRDRVLELVRHLADDPAILEIIVVVDGGDDETMTALTVIARTVRTLRPIAQEHAGAGAARQRGLEQASGDIVLFLDDDVVPAPYLASGHLAAHRASPGQLVVGSLPPVRTGTRTAHSVVDELYAEDYDTCRRDYERDPESVLAHLWSGNLSLDRRQALVTGIGDSEFDRLFFEDRDFGLRLRAAGVQAAFRPDLCALHHHVGSLRGYLRDSLRQGRALHLLHQRYADVVPEPTPRLISGRFPLAARLLVTAAARNPDTAGAAATTGLLVVSYLAGILRLWAVQRPFVVLLRRVGQARGVGLARQGHQDGERG